MIDEYMQFAGQNQESFMLMADIDGATVLHSAAGNGHAHIAKHVLELANKLDMETEAKTGTRVRQCNTHMSC